jgi:hypothetical protein
MGRIGILEDIKINVTEQEHPFEFKGIDKMLHAHENHDGCIQI